MGQYNLNRIFKPRHVAVVGASEKAGTIGNALMRNLIDGGFSGMLLPVNPKYKSIHGHESFESVSALETGVDLAIIATPIHSVVDIVSECVEKKVGCLLPPNAIRLCTGRFSGPASRSGRFWLPSRKKKRTFSSWGQKAGPIWQTFFSAPPPRKCFAGAPFRC